MGVGDALLTGDVTGFLSVTEPKSGLKGDFSESIFCPKIRSKMLLDLRTLPGTTDIGEYPLEWFSFVLSLRLIAENGVADVLTTVSPLVCIEDTLCVEELSLVVVATGGFTENGKGEAVLLWLAVRFGKLLFKESAYSLKLPALVSNGELSTFFKIKSFGRVKLNELALATG